jgi:hypothetical protein
MKTYMQPIMTINELVTKTAGRVGDLIRVKGNSTEELALSIKDLIETLRENEKNTLDLPKEDLYFIGKVIGRLEATYGILMRGIANGRKREEENNKKP